MTGERLLQISGAVIDLVYRVDRVPRPGDEAAVSESTIAVGGGFNSMIAARRAGMDVTYGGSHGTGAFADLLRRVLEDERIPALQAPLENIDQGSTVVLVDKQGERTFISQTGAEGMVKACQLAAVDPAQFGWILVSGYTLSYTRDKAMLRDWLQQLPVGPRLVFDPSPVVERIDAALLQAMLSRADWISANAREAMALTGEARPEQAARELAARRPGGAVVRCGAEGCWAAPAAEAARHVPGYLVSTTDSNGAGDAHIGAFVAALSRGEDPTTAADFANAAAALSTTRFGPATAPSLAEVRAFLDRAGRDATAVKAEPR